MSHREILKFMVLLAAYTALVCGLQLDGYIRVSWTLALLPVWFPVIMTVVLFLLWIMVFSVVVFTEKIIKKIQGWL